MRVHIELNNTPKRRGSTFIAETLHEDVVKAVTARPLRLVTLKQRITGRCRESLLRPHYQLLLLLLVLLLLLLGHAQ